jgi:hypothetical protein
VERWALRFGRGAKRQAHGAKRPGSSALRVSDTGVNVNLRAHLIALAGGCLLLLVATCWLLLRFTHRDVAGVLGALAGTVFPIASASIYGAWLWEKHPDTRGKSVTEWKAHFYRHVYPTVAPYIVPCLFSHALATGLWIGIVGTQPILLAVTYYALWLVIARVCGGNPGLKNVAVVSATLAMASLLGHGLSGFLMPG